MKLTSIRKEKNFLPVNSKEQHKNQVKKGGAEKIEAMHEAERGPIFQGQQEEIS